MSRQSEVDNPRIYGEGPYRIALLHGGPGAPGTMAPVARELESRGGGLLEPLQTRFSVEEQVSEVLEVLERYAELPAILVGSSWGAMLAYLVAAHTPSAVAKLILVGSGVYREEDAAGIQQERLARLDEEGRREVSALLESLADSGIAEKDAILSRLGEIFLVADAFDPLTSDCEVLECQYDLHVRVWSEVQALRRSGRLLELGRRIECPVVALHGDYDPHPRKGIEEPLGAVIRDFRFIALAKCGHLPWIERHGREEFFRLLSEELALLR